MPGLLARQAQKNASGGGTVAAAADAVTRDPSGAVSALRTELRILLSSLGSPESPLAKGDAAALEDLASRAERADAFATAALARQRAGTYKGTPWGTEGGA